MLAKAAAHQKYASLWASDAAWNFLGEQGEGNIQSKQLSIFPRFRALTFAEQLLEGCPGQGASNLQPLRDNCRRDELVVGHFFAQFVIGGLVKQDEVVQLVSHFPLGPLLLEQSKKNPTKPPSKQ